MTECFLYRLDGQLSDKVDRKGMCTHYESDPLGRIKEEVVYTPKDKTLKQTFHIYNSLHLLQTIDPQG